MEHMTDKINKVVSIDVKTAKEYAEKNGLQYICLDVTKLDIFDISMFPIQSKHSVEYIVPNWAIKSNDKPTLIHFSDMNRLKNNLIKLQIMKIISTYSIDEKFYFKENVVLVY